VSKFSASQLRVLVDLIQGCGEVSNELSRLLGMEHKLNSGGLGVAGLADANVEAFKVANGDAVAGGCGPFAHEATVKLKFADGKVVGFTCTTDCAEARPFYVGVTLPQPEGAGSDAALAA